MNNQLVPLVFLQLVTTWISDCAAVQANSNATVNASNVTERNNTPVTCAEQGLSQVLVLGHQGVFCVETSTPCGELDQQLPSRVEGTGTLQLRDKCPRVGAVDVTGQITLASTTCCAMLPGSQTLGCVVPTQELTCRGEAGSTVVSTTSMPSPSTESATVAMPTTSNESENELWTATRTASSPTTPAMEESLTIEVTSSPSPTVTKNANETNPVPLPPTTSSPLPDNSSRAPMDPRMSTSAPASSAMAETASLTETATSSPTQRPPIVTDTAPPATTAPATRTPIVTETISPAPTPSASGAPPVVSPTSSATPTATPGFPNTSSPTMRPLMGSSQGSSTPSAGSTGTPTSDVNSRSVNVLPKTSSASRSFGSSGVEERGSVFQTNDIAGVMKQPTMETSEQPSTQMGQFADFPTPSKTESADTSPTSLNLQPIADDPSGLDENGQRLRRRKSEVNGQKTGGFSMSGDSVMMVAVGAALLIAVLGGFVLFRKQKPSKRVPPLGTPVDPALSPMTPMTPATPLTPMTPAGEPGNGSFVFSTPQRVYENPFQLYDGMVSPMMPPSPHSRAFYCPALTPPPRDPKATPRQDFLLL